MSPLSSELSPEIYFNSRWRQETETFIEVLSEREEESLDLVSICHESLFSIFETFSHREFL